MAENEGKPLVEVFENPPAAKKEKYIYSMPDCPKCDKRKTYLRENHINFFERKGDRLNGDTRLMDDIDREAHLQLQMQNLTFPVEIDIVESL